MMIKAIFFDIDGTLTDFRTASIPEDTICCLNELHEKGIKLFIATGRHVIHMWQAIPKELPFDGYVTLNGQIGLNHDGQMIYGRTIHPEDQATGIRLANEKATLIMLIEEHRNYLNYYDESMAAMYERFKVAYPDISVSDGAPIYQISMYGTAEERKEFVNQLPHCRPVSWGLGFDLIPTDGGKIAGIREMIRHYGISIEETMAFGDAENDLDMIEGCGVGVAMAKSPDFVREKADFVTFDAGDGGIRHALEHYGIL